MTGPRNSPSSECVDDLLRRSQPRLDQVLRRYSIPREDREDLRQACLMEMLRRWSMIKTPEAWLISALRNHCLMYWRSRRRQRFRLTETGDLDRRVRCERASPEQKALYVQLLEVLDELPEKVQQILWLRFGLGLRPIDVARCLGYRTSGASTLIRRASEDWRQAAESTSRRRFPGPLKQTEWPRTWDFDAGTVEVTL